MLGSRVPMLFLNDPPKMVHRSTYEDIPVEGLSNLADKGSRQELALDEALEKFDIGDFQRLIYEGKVNKKPIGYFNAVIMTMVDSCKEGE